MADKLSELEPVQEVWNFPLYDAIFGRRSRRFGWGMEINSPPNKFKSTHDPLPLDEVEEALLIAAATAVSGLNLSDMPHTPRPEKAEEVGNWDGMCNTMLEHVGRTWSSACGNHGTELFYTNDDGVYLVRGHDTQPGAMQEYANRTERDRLVDFVRENRVKLFDGRIDIPRNTGSVLSVNLWNVNMPGTTLFMPVGEITEEYINAIMLQADHGQYLVDDRNGMRPCISERMIKDGHVNTPVPLSMLEMGMVSAISAEAAFIAHNIVLAEQAIGLGGWVFGGATSFLWMGGTPACRGLGFRFESSAKDPSAFPVPVGIDGAFESFRPPYYKDMDAAVDAIVAKKFGPAGIFNPFSDKPAPYKDRTDYLRQVPRTSEKSIAIAKETCRYIWDTYGTFPAFVPPMLLYLYAQAQHCELEFYDKYYRDGAYLPTHKSHVEKWHRSARASRKVA